MHGDRVAEYAYSAIGSQRWPRKESTISGELIAVHAKVNRYKKKMKILIDSGASCNYARLHTIALNEAMYAEAQRSSQHGGGEILVRLATGGTVATPKILIDLRMKFEDFNSVETCVVLDMDARYDVILGVPWLVKHQPWIDWRTRPIGSSDLVTRDRALVSHVPTSAREQRAWIEPKQTSYVSVVSWGDAPWP